MDTKLDFKIGTKQEYEVIGQGPVPKTPCQIGDWWVVKAEDYQGKIPPDIQRKLFAFIGTQKVEGFLIAEDMRIIEAKKQREAEKVEARKQAMETGVGVLRSVFGALAMGIVYLFSAILSFDPMLIAVLPTGEWICLGTWYE